MPTEPHHHHHRAGVLERLAAYSIHHRGHSPLDHRRAADRAIHEATAAQLGAICVRLEQAIHECLGREALSEVPALERLRALADRVAQRIRHAGPGHRALALSKSPDGVPDPVHALDLDLYDRAEALHRRFDAPAHDHDFLPAIMAELTLMDRRLHDRALLLAADATAPKPTAKSALLDEL